MDFGKSDYQDMFSESGNGFLNRFFNPETKSNFITMSSAAGGWGLVASAAEYGLVLEQKIGVAGNSYISTATVRANAKLGAAWLKNIGGPALGAAGVGFTVLESLQDGKMSAGDWTKIGIGLVTTGLLLTFLGPVAVGYAILDIGVGLYTGTSITDRIAAGIEGN